MKKFDLRLWALLLIVLVAASCQDDPDTPGDLDNGIDGDLREALINAGGTNGINHFLLPESNDYSSIPQDPNNPLSSPKVELGKRLFFETGLAINPKDPSGAQTYSCASCHVPGNCFQPGIRQGIAEGGWGFGYTGEGRTADPNYDIADMDLQPIRTPTVMNGAYNRTTLWNGQFGATGPNEGTEAAWTVDTPKETNLLGFEGVETQAIAGLEVHRMGLNMELVNNSYYKDMFDYAFPDFPEAERYSQITTGLAIAAYERTVLSNKAPFQQWLKGDTEAMTEQQKLGALLFFGKAGCNDCHSGPALNSEAFHALGMADLTGDGVLGDFPNFANVQRGRGGFTGDPADDYKFKTPQLYGLREMKFLGHGSSFTNVRDVIVYKNEAAPENADVPTSQLAAEFLPLGLSDEEIDQLAAFLNDGLDDTQLSRYVPTSIASGNCFPNNDQQSRIDSGCE